MAIGEVQRLGCIRCISEVRRSLRLLRLLLLLLLLVLLLCVSMHGVCMCCIGRVVEGRLARLGGAVRRARRGRGCGGMICACSHRTAAVACTAGFSHRHTRCLPIAMDNNKSHVHDHKQMKS